MFTFHSGRVNSIENSVLAEYSYFYRGDFKLFVFEFSIILSTGIIFDILPILYEWMRHSLRDDMYVNS